MNNYISILLDELKGVFSEKDKIYFSGSSLKALIDEIEGLQTKVQLKNDELDDKDDKITKLEAIVNKIQNAMYDPDIAIETQPYDCLVNVIEEIISERRQ